MKNWTTSQWFMVMVVAAFVTAISAIQWYDWNHGWSKVTTVVGALVAAYALYKVSGANPGNQSHENPK